MTKIAGSGAESVSHRYGPLDPDPDKNVTTVARYEQIKQHFLVFAIFLHKIIRYQPNQLTPHKCTSSGTRKGGKNQIEVSTPGQLNYLVRLNSSKLVWFEFGSKSRTRILMWEFGNKDADPDSDDNPISIQLHHICA
jgi:hypothetical protein